MLIYLMIEQTKQPLVTCWFTFLQVGERIRVILDCEDNTLAFEKNYEFLGKYYSWWQF